MQKTELVIDGSKEKPILLDITYTKNGQLKPIVILCHGFKGFKDWGHFNLIAEEFAQQGFVFIKFTMSHSGTTLERPIDFVDLDAFGHNNFLIELEDTGLILDFIEEHAGNFQGDLNQIYLIGHSRGGGIAILKAAEDSRIQKLVTWASVKDFADFFIHQNIDNWKSNDKIYSINSRTQQEMPLYYQIYENYISHKERLNIPKAASSLQIPWLIIHGTNDASVPINYSEFLNNCNSMSNIIKIKESDHSFGGKHPWVNPTLPLHSKALLRHSIRFLKK